MKIYKTPKVHVINVLSHRVLCSSETYQDPLTPANSYGEGGDNAY